MAEETVELVPATTLTFVPQSYVIDFNGQRLETAGVRYRLGRNAFSGPVAHKAAVGGRAAKARLMRELEVSRYLGARGGELLSKCIGYNFDNSTPMTVVTYRGRPLAELVRDNTNWPLAHAHRAKIIADLLQGVELLRVSSIVHGDISLNTLHWDGTTLQIVDFGQAALRGTYPDGRDSHHGDDISAVSRVIYHVHTGQPPPDAPDVLRKQIEHVQDTELRELLLCRDLVTGIDVDYAFAPDPERRPTTRVLLDRLDRRPHGVQWDQLVAKEQAIRAQFHQLREWQGKFRAVYLPWAAEQAKNKPVSLPRQRRPVSQTGIPAYGPYGAGGYRPVPLPPPRKPYLVWLGLVAVVLVFILAVLVGALR